MSRPNWPRQKVHHIEAVVDRIVIREGVRGRDWPNRSTWPCGTATAWCWPVTRSRRASGETVWHDELFSTQYACPNCKISYEELEPRTFSFNSPYGACPTCEGLGSREAFDPELVLPDPRAFARRRRDRAVEGGDAGGHAEAPEPRWTTGLPPPASLGDAAGRRSSPRRSQQLLHGDGKRFPGVLVLLEKEYATTTSEAKRQQLEAFRGEVVCPECQGARLRPEARAVRLAGRAIHEVTAMTVAAARQFFDGLELPDGPPTRSPSRSSARSPRGWSSSTTWAWTTSRSTGRPTRSAAANCSACGWPAGWARGWSACATCSTSRRSACTRATTSG